MDEDRERAARIVHDVANRLVAVSARLARLSGSLADELRATLCGEAEDELRAARTLLTSLLGAPATSADDAGSTAVTVLREAAERSGHVLDERVADETAVAAIDAAALREVLGAVLSAEAGETITSSVARRAGSVSIVLESARRAFAPAERARLLGRVRLRNPAALGGGLGFGAAAEILRRSGGSFVLGSGQGGNRRYTFELPGRSPRAASASLSLLVVDDEPGTRRAIELLLESLGHHAESVAGAAEALGRLERGGIDGLIIDLRLAGDEDGARLAAEVRERHPELAARTVIATGDPSGAAALSALGHPVLAKPFGATELAQVLKARTV